MNSIMKIPVFDDKALAACTPAELIDIMIEHADRVPRNVIDVCVSRGEPMLDALTSIAPPNRELENTSIGHWWLRLHAVMILGLIPGERAGQILLEFIHGMCGEEDDNLQEWFSGYWPALLHNKPHSISMPLHELCMDKKIYWFMRANLFEAVIEQAQQQGEAALEQTLDWAAQMVADEAEDWDYRLLVANDLLDFPRDRHRSLITELTVRQSVFGVHFNEKDINKAYARKIDQPSWEGFGNPWRFYEEKEIGARQQRWQEEDRDDDIDPNSIEVIARELGYHDQGTCQRETSKVGRNYPCPCGSGRKYKKCCLGKE